MANVLDNAADRGGLDGITMAAAYHQGRDIFPHNPARKVHFLEGETFARTRAAAEKRDEIAAAENMVDRLVLLGGKFARRCEVRLRSRSGPGIPGARVATHSATHTSRTFARPIPTCAPMSSR